MYLASSTAREILQRASLGFEATRRRNANSRAVNGTGDLCSGPRRRGREALAVRRRDVVARRTRVENVPA